MSRLALLALGLLGLLPARAHADTILTPNYNVLWAPACGPLPDDASDWSEEQKNRYVMAKAIEAARTERDGKTYTEALAVFMKNRPKVTGPWADYRIIETTSRAPLRVSKIRDPFGPGVRVSGLGAKAALAFVYTHHAALGISVPWRVRVAEVGRVDERPELVFWELTQSVGTGVTCHGCNATVIVDAKSLRVVEMVNDLLDLPAALQTKPRTTAIEASEALAAMRPELHQSNYKPSRSDAATTLGLVADGLGQVRLAWVVIVYPTCCSRPPLPTDDRWTRGSKMFLALDASNLSILGYVPSSSSVSMRIYRRYDFCSTV